MLEGQVRLLRFSTLGSIRRLVPRRTFPCGRTSVTSQLRVSLRCGNDTCWGSEALTRRLDRGLTRASPLQFSGLAQREASVKMFRSWSRQFYTHTPGAISFEDAQRAQSRLELGLPDPSNGADSGLDW